MKTLIVYSSIHHDNTKKIAETMAKTLEADLARVSDARNITLEQYDLIGFGSGIYNGKFHAKLLQMIENADLTGKRVFVFSTSGYGTEKYNKSLQELLSARGANVVNSFACKGYDTFGFLKWIGGIAKGHPDEDDFNNVRNFAKGLTDNK